MNKQFNSIPSDGAKDEQSDAAEVTTSSQPIGNTMLAAALSVEEGNKLIAAFMGCYKYPIGGYEVKHMSKALVFPKDLLYHYSWDWLMPVVEKIESIGYRVNFCYSASAIMPLKNVISIELYEIGTSNIKEIYEGKESTNKIEAVWLAIVEFIKWYNKQNAVSKR